MHPRKTSPHTAMQLPPKPDDTGKTTEEIWQELCGLCRDYLFPPGMPVVRKVLARLATYAKYGPGVRLEDGHVALRGGCPRLLQRHEDKQLLDEEERAVLAEVYNYSSSTSNMNIVPRDLQVTLRKGGGSMHGSTTKINGVDLTTTMAHHADRPRAAASLIAPNTTCTAIPDDLLGEMLRRKNPLMHELLEMTRFEVDQLLASAVYPSREKNQKPVRRSTLSDHLSEALLAERQRRVQAMKVSKPDFGVVRTDPTVSRRQSVLFYNTSSPKPRELRSYDNPADVQLALHRYSSQISEVGVGGGGAEIAFNVRCLREDFVPDRTKEGWDGYCCVRGVNPSPISTLRKQ
jgi:hypothetical protein